jgi:hypothetical protein
MQGYGELGDSKIARKMSAVAAYNFNDAVTDFVGEFFEFGP